MNHVPLLKQAYIGPIRTVMLVDEKFLTAAEMSKLLAKPVEERPSIGTYELEREAELWAACQERGWACDVENNPRAGNNFRRVQNCDLIVLDYHLGGLHDDVEDSLAILKDLARSERSNLVIMYTSDTQLEKVRRRIAATLRGARRFRNEVQQVQLDAFLDVVELGDVGFTDMHVDHLLAGRPSHRQDSELGRKLLEHRIDRDDHPWMADALIEQFLEEAFKVERCDEIHALEMSASGDSRYWLRCGNVFVVFADKQSSRGAQVFAALEEALVAWNPPPLVASMAFARRLIADGGFNMDVHFLSQDPALHAGWLLHALRESPATAESSLATAESSPATAESSPATAESSPVTAESSPATAESPPAVERGVRDLFGRVVSGLAEQVVEDLAAFGAKFMSTASGAVAQSSPTHRARRLARVEETDVDDAAIHMALNAFLCSEPFRRNHVTTGTIFRSSSAGHDIYWVCASPACDMVPRAEVSTKLPPAETQSSGEKATGSKPKKFRWPDELGKFRAMTAVRANLVLEESVRRVLKNATKLQHVFFRDSVSNCVRALQVLEDAQPATELLFAVNLARVADGRFHAYRVTGHADGPQFIRTEMVVVGQLRSAYAGRLLQATGNHSSRIGIDFVNLVG